MQPAPLATAGVVGAKGFCGVIHKVTVAEGLNTYNPARCRLMVATSWLTLLTVVSGSAFGLGKVVPSRCPSD